MSTVPVPRDHQDHDEVGKLAVRIANAAVLPMVLKSAIELNLVDIISAAGEDESAFLSPSEIASRLPTKNPDAPALLDRMLRLLASYDILKCSVRTAENGEVERFYGAGSICKFLTMKEDEAGSFAPLFLFHHDKVFLESWYHLSEAVLNGGAPFRRAHGVEIFEYARRDQRFNTLINEAFSNHTSLIMNRILDVYDGFKDVRVLVDVGGGTGLTLSIIICKHTQIKGINYELPHVLANAPSYSGVEHVVGDMFISVPKGDAIFLKWILHSWSDEDCLKILKNCWQALPQNGKIIVVESILPVMPKNEVSSHIVCEQDLIMLANRPGGKERTQKQYEDLGQKSGFHGFQVICCAYNCWVMELRK